MPRKRKAEDESEPQSKKQREYPTAAAAVSSPAEARAAHADALMAEAKLHRFRFIECAKLASCISRKNKRPIDQRAVDVKRLLEEDSKRKQPLLTLSFELEVSSRVATVTVQRCMSVG
jgi:hypothetical protein